MNLKTWFVSVFILGCFYNSFAQPLKWTSLAPGVWKATIGKPEVYNLLTASGAKPNMGALAKLGTASFPLTINDITGVVRYFNQ